MQIPRTSRLRLIREIERIVRGTIMMSVHLEVLGPNELDYVG